MVHILSTRVGSALELKALRDKTVIISRVASMGEICWVLSLIAHKRFTHHRSQSISSLNVFTNTRMRGRNPVPGLAIASVNTEQVYEPVKSLVSNSHLP